VITPAAIAFSERISAQYRRARPFEVRPVDSVLRTLPAPLRVEHRIFVDARSWRTVAAVAERAAAVVHRAMPTARPVVMRTGERLRRDEDPAVASSPRMTWLPPVAERLRGRGEVDPRPVRSVSMVLARQAAPAESRTVKDSIDATAGWPSSSATVRPVSRHADTAPALSATDVNHLTERVVAAIDRRMVAARERIGL
jgi:hypothetical protein